MKYRILLEPAEWLKTTLDIRSAAHSSTLSHSTPVSSLQAHGGLFKPTLGISNPSLVFPTHAEQPAPFSRKDVRLRRSSPGLRSNWAVQLLQHQFKCFDLMLGECLTVFQPCAVHFVHASRLLPADGSTLGGRDGDVACTGCTN
jgi:hypothetical protein